MCVVTRHQYGILRSFLKRHFAGKSVADSRHVGFFSQAIIFVVLGVLWQLPTPSNTVLWPVYRLCGKSCHLLLVRTLLLLYFRITGNIFANVTAEQTSSVKQFFLVLKRRSQYKNECNHFSFTSPPSFLSPFLFFPTFFCFVSVMFGHSGGKHLPFGPCLLKCLQMSLGKFSKIRLDTGKCRLLYFKPQKLQLFMILNHRNYSFS